MDGEQGGGGGAGGPFEIPGMAGKTIARAVYTEWQPEMDKPPGDPSAKRVRGVRLNLVGGDVVQMISRESILVNVQPVAVYAWLAKMSADVLPPPPDYRALLAKYIDHVGRNEGVDFLQDADRTDKFTDAEWAELQRLAEETRKP